MESYFSNLFEDVGHERSLILLLSLVEPNILKQSKFTDHEIEIFKNLALEKLHRQRILKENIALDLLEKQFSDYQMITYPDLKNEPELLKIKTRDDEIKNLKYTQEKHDFENILKSLKAYNKSINKKYKSLNGKKILLIITEILVGGGSAIGTSTMALINPSVGIVISSSTALLTSIAILITNEYISKLKIRYTKPRDWINVNTLLHEKTLKEAIIDKKN